MVLPGVLRIRAVAAALLALCLGAGISSRAAAQLLEVPSIVHQVKGNHDRIDMVVNTSRHLVMDKKIPQAQVSNPEILAITPLSAHKIQISAKKPGVTQVNLWDEDNKVHTIDVVVFADAQELTLLLKAQFPKAALRVIPLANSVLITGYVDDPDEITRITEIAQDYHPKVINQVRVGGVQEVLLYVRVMEVSRADLRQLGFDFAAFGGNSLITSGISGLITAASASTQSLTLSGGQTVTASLFHGASQLDAVLNCLRQNDLLKIVAEPNLLCISGRPAFFNVGGEFPILVPQSLGTVSIQYKKFGTQLDFVPIVLGNNRIRLEVRPRISEIDPTRSITINGTTVPGLRVREAETGVEMRAGETLAIAGLVQQRVEAQKRGIPWLGDMPGIGFIFRSTREQVTEIETLILVTPQFAEGMECHEVPPCGPGLETVSPTHPQLWCEGQLEVPCGRFGIDVHRPGCDNPANCGPGCQIMRGDLMGLPPGVPMPAAEAEAVPTPVPAETKPAPEAGATSRRRRPQVSSASQGSGAAGAVRILNPSPVGAGAPREASGPALSAGQVLADAAAGSRPVEHHFNPNNLSKPPKRQPGSQAQGANSAPGLIGPVGYDLHK